MKSGEKMMDGEKVCKTVVLESNPYVSTSCELIERKIDIDTGTKILYIQVNNE